MSLNEYRGKRKPGKTPEPFDTRARKGAKLRFVVQKHAATRMHYDFRIEIGGALKSWAVPKGPSLNPVDQRLAIHVEDHPLAYGSFEGIIPPGNYGAGTVMVWDAGTYEERAQKGRALDEQALLKGIQAGKITLLLNGKKLKGEFALVRVVKKGTSPKTWLLLKKRDGFAAYGENLFDENSVLSGRTMQEIADRSPRSRKPPEDGFPHAVRAMRAVATFKPPQVGGKTDQEWIFEPETRGHRAIAEITPQGVRLYSQGLLPLEKKFAKVVEALRKTGQSAVFDGQVVLSKPAGEIYLVSDLLYWKGKDLRETPLRERKKILATLPIFNKTVKLQKFETSLAAIPTKARETPLDDYTIAKRATSVYRSGLSRDWLRFRLPPSRKGPVPASPFAGTDRPPLTNLAKVFWPDEGITKGDLIFYYEKVAPYILAYLAGRPESLHRQPGGIRDKGFFHKDMVGYLPRRIATTSIYSRSSGRTVHYLLCDDRWTLLYLANMGCIEIHPWLSRVGNLDRPDFAVIDLDPDGNSFDEVVQVAREVYRVLSAVGAESWCKTSGATGLHLCIPMGGKYPYDPVRGFAEAACHKVWSRLPTLTSMERNPAKRRGKIYLDFMQNRRSQTLAAPYCVRPFPGAPVSAPLKWSEVKPGLDPATFNIQTMPKRLSKMGDLWLANAKKPADLEKCHHRLLKLK